jgi:tetratricopeptide (TPR) repeat protein
MMTCHIGETHRDAGRYGAAISDLNEARRMFAELPDRPNEARTVTELGHVYLLAGDLEQGRRLFEKALEEMTRLDSPYEQARIRVALAATARRLGDALGARQQLEAAHAFYLELGAPEAESVRLLLSEVADPA